MSVPLSTCTVVIVELTVIGLLMVTSEELLLAINGLEPPDGLAVFSVV